MKEADFPGYLVKWLKKDSLRGRVSIRNYNKPGEKKNGKNKVQKNKNQNKAPFVFIIKGFQSEFFLIINLKIHSDLSSRTHGVTVIGVGFLTSREIIIWRLQVQSWLQSSDDTGILNTCTRLRLTESERVTPVDSIKDVFRSSVKLSDFDKHLKKAEGHIGWNVMEITIKMKTIVQKPLMIKIHQASSQKFWQLMFRLSVSSC